MTWHQEVAEFIARWAWRKDSVRPSQFATHRQLQSAMKDKLHPLPQYRAVIHDGHCNLHRLLGVMSTKEKQGKGKGSPRVESNIQECVDGLIASITQPFDSPMAADDAYAGVECIVAVFDKGVPQPKEVTAAKRMAARRAKAAPYKDLSIFYDKHGYYGFHRSIGLSYREDTALGSQQLELEVPDTQPMDAAECCGTPKQRTTKAFEVDRLLSTSGAGAKLLDAVVELFADQAAASLTHNLAKHQKVIFDYRSHVYQTNVVQVITASGATREKSLEIRAAPGSKQPAVEEGEWGLVRYLKHFYPHPVLVNSVDGDCYPLLAYYLENQQRAHGGTCEQDIYWLRSKSHDIVHVNCFFAEFHARTRFTADMICLCALCENDYLDKQLFLPRIGVTAILGAIYLAGPEMCALIVRPPAHASAASLHAFQCLLLLCYLCQAASYRIPGDLEIEQEYAAHAHHATQAREGQACVHPKLDFIEISTCEQKIDSSEPARTSIGIEAAPVHADRKRKLPDKDRESTEPTEPTESTATANSKNNYPIPERKVKHASTRTGQVQRRRAVAATKRAPSNKSLRLDIYNKMMTVLQHAPCASESQPQQHGQNTQEVAREWFELHRHLLALAKSYCTAPTLRAILTDKTKFGVNEPPVLAGIHRVVMWMAQVWCTASASDQLIANSSTPNTFPDSATLSIMQQQTTAASVSCMTSTSTTAQPCKQKHGHEHPRPTDEQNDPSSSTSDVLLKYPVLDTLTKVPREKYDGDDIFWAGFDVVSVI